MTDIPEELRPFFSDYKINLVQILNSGHYQFYNEEYTNKSIGSEIINLVTAIITMIELGLTKEQILTKYSEEDYLKAEEALNNKDN